MDPLTAALNLATEQLKLFQTPTGQILLAKLMEINEKILTDLMTFIGNIQAKIMAKESA